MSIPVLVRTCLNVCLIYLDGNLQLGFMLIALIWKFDFSPFMILVIAILNDGELSHSTLN